MKHLRIETLTRTLLDYGYHVRQVQHIVEEVRQSSGAEAMEDAIIEALEAYVEFAARCKQQGSSCR
ncbi:hypothetical protein [Sporomusa sphaeroides]|jgi:Holliday junction resolvasome RuvABC DNA-binding subunit|uniref:hypothetical protein n=1 Tax=Sporomusa sphaeroides TaxID=47679 RepID=UPI002BACC932|nr:hypothetical protein [Sporomusa sphaeroides]HML32234.1 hypothetical protein [Sporomusa sphaeroides]